MQLIREHIQLCLRPFLNVNTVNIDDTLNNLQSSLNADFTALLRYIENVLNETFISSNDPLSALHIHLGNELNDSQKLQFAEYLLIKTFKHYHSTENRLDQPNIELKEILTTLKAKQDGLEMRCPDGASGKNGGNRIWKNWVQDKKNTSSLLEFYSNINENSQLKPKSIFNTQKNFSQLVTKLFEFRPFSVAIGSKYQSYNLLNVNHTLNEIDNTNNEIIDGLESIILFECERKSKMSNFSFEEISKWNSEYGTTFKNYLIITFGKEPHSFNIVRNKNRHS